MCLHRVETSFVWHSTSCVRSSRRSDQAVPSNWTQYLSRTHHSFLDSGKNNRHRIHTQRYDMNVYTIPGILKNETPVAFERTAVPACYVPLSHVGFCILKIMEHVLRRLENYHTHLLLFAFCILLFAFCCRHDYSGGTRNWLHASRGNFVPSARRLDRAVR